MAVRIKDKKETVVCGVRLHSEANPYIYLFYPQGGLLNHIFHTKINWISDPKIAVYAIAVIGVWSIIGYNMVLFLSGLQEIPRDYYEAASIDGATGIKQFFHITIPLLSPTIFFVMVTRVIGAMQVFDLIFMVMDRNNPALYKTQSLVYLFYQNSFVQNNKGYGSTIVVLLLVVIMIMTVFQNIAQKMDDTMAFEAMTERFCPAFINPPVYMEMGQL